MTPTHVSYEQAYVAWRLALDSLRKQLTGVLYWHLSKLYRIGEPCNQS